MFVAGIPTYSIDLTKDQSERWAEVISCEKAVSPVSKWFFALARERLKSGRG